MKRSSIIVAVESYLLRKGLVTILNRVPGLTVIREFNSTAPLMKFMQTRGQDLLVISQPLFDDSSEIIYAAGDLLERTILLTHDRPGKSADGIHSMDTGDSKEELIKKIGDLLEAQPHNPGEPELSDLSPREKTILRLVSLGYTNKHIAQELFLSAHTVITHRKNISHKLGIKTVSALTVYAIVNNIITIEEINLKPV
jgi:DNA-binding CsgD family transcriptional regulator